MGLKIVAFTKEIQPKGGERDGLISWLIGKWARRWINCTSTNLDLLMISLEASCLGREVLWKFRIGFGGPGGI
ncbi:hypothetical protein P8X34_08575 [Pyrococcus kukulkanii]|uniref:Uncharacterized protein n=1 Tax=Pyrococcus kukulkanii TaxID=1609559 RepID=A0ABV4T4J5_9EURY